MLDHLTSRAGLALMLSLSLMNFREHCAAQETVAPNESLESLNRKRDFLDKFSADYLLMHSDKDTSFQQSAQSILNYSNPGRDVGPLMGNTKVWLDGQQPIAACCFSLRVPQERLYFEFVSLSEHGIVCKNQQNTVWNPRSRSTQPKELIVKSLPATNANRRLLQMRNLARQFQAAGFAKSTGEKTDLRLMTQPIYRYRSDTKGIIDGALFAFVVENDPELLLQLEAVGDEATSDLKWQYSLARMTSWRIEVRHNGQPVWGVDNYYESGGRKPHRSYYEGRLGYYNQGRLQSTPAFE